MAGVSSNFRKNLKNPDKFQIIAALILKYIYEYRIQIGIALLSIGIVVLGLWGGSYWLSNLERQREQKLSKIDKEFLDEEINVQKQKNEILNNLKNIEEKLKNTKAKEEIANLEKQKLEYLQKLQDIKINYDKFISLYEKFFHEYKTYPQGWNAAVKLASILINKSEFDKALDVLNQVEKLIKNNQFYKYYVNYMKLDAMINAQKYDEALANIDKLVSLAPPDLRPMLIFKKAQTQLKLNKKEEALNTLDTLIKDYSGSTEASSALGLKILIQQKNFDISKK